MKRILIITAIILTVLCANLHRSASADDPGFCLEGWMVEDTSTIRVSDCVITYTYLHCNSTFADLTCHTSVCGGEVVAEVCNED
jgi:hypothetical protein